MTTKQVTNIHVTGNFDGGNIAIGCDYNGARYHVWIDSRTLENDPESTLYKNPPIGCMGMDWYNTRYLRQNGAIGRVVMPAMLAAFPEALAIARREHNEQRAQQEAKNAEAIRLHRIKEAGPELLEALRKIAFECASYNDCWETAQAAIAKAQGE